MTPRLGGIKPSAALLKWGGRRIARETEAEEDYPKLLAAIHADHARGVSKAEIGRQTGFAPATLDEILKPPEKKRSRAKPRAAATQ